MRLTFSLFTILFALSFSMTSGFLVSPRQEYEFPPNPDTNTNFSPTKNNNYSYFLFTNFWPPACHPQNRPSLPPPVNRFTVHGIWPERADGTWPQFCNKTAKFNETALRDLEPYLRYVWYDYLHGNPDNITASAQFWKHEWDKHGTCALGQFQTEHNFFATAILLHYKYNFLEALQKHGIQANNSYYPRTQMEAALRTEFGVNLCLMCNGCHNTKPDHLQMVELCLDKQEFKPMNCYRPSACPDRVLLQAF